MARRYADQSYLVSLERSRPNRRRLELYSEVLLKIDTYHVNEAELEAAGVPRRRSIWKSPLSEPAFVDRFPHPVVGATSPRLRGEIQTAIECRRRSRIAARLWMRSRRRPNRGARLAVSPQAAILEFTCAAVSSLDQYSAYLTGNQLDEVFSQIEGNFVGLGIELKAEDALVADRQRHSGRAGGGGRACGPMTGSSKSMASRPHEISPDAAADMLKGPEFSYVDIVLQTPDGHAAISCGSSGGCVDVPSVQDIKIIDTESGVAYMKLTSFQKTTSRDVDAALGRCTAKACGR